MVLILSHSSEKFLQKNFISLKKYHWKSSGSSLKNIIPIDYEQLLAEKKRKKMREDASTTRGNIRTANWCWLLLWKGKKTRKLMPVAITFRWWWWWLIGAQSIRRRDWIRHRQSCVFSLRDCHYALYRSYVTGQGSRRIQRIEGHGTTFYCTTSTFFESVLSF